MNAASAPVSSALFIRPTAKLLRSPSNILIVVLIVVLMMPMTTVMSFTPSLATQRYRHVLFYQNDANVVRQRWVEKSVSYYSKVMREERRRNLGQSNTQPINLQTLNRRTTDQTEYLTLAKKHYFALRKVKDGKHQHAESIYRRIIDELMEEDEDCDHAKLAVTTLLLALHMQRSKESVKQARSVFLSFFRVVTSSDNHAPCACSAKVLQAFALFEMKQGNELKSYRIVLKAIELDPELRPVLKWKQFRNAHERYEQLKRRNSLAP